MALTYEFEFKDDNHLPNAPVFEHRVCVASNVRQVDSLPTDPILLDLSTKYSWITDKAILNVTNSTDSNSISVEFSISCDETQKSHKSDVPAYTTSTEHHTVKFTAPILSETATQTQIKKINTPKENVVSNKKPKITADEKGQEVKFDIKTTKLIIGINLIILSWCL